MSDSSARLYPRAPAALFEHAVRLPTPAIVYDLDAIRQVVERIGADCRRIPGGKLNIALKACHTPEVLAFLAGLDLGLGCDVASPGELVLAQHAGFREITCTGPAYSASDFEAFHAAGVVPDIDSISQLRFYGQHFPGRDVGLRIRIPLPKRLESNATFGADSRFGMIITDPEIGRILETYRLTPVRLHVHTGQTTPEALVYKTNYLLEIAGALPGIHTVDLGGGLFHLYVDQRRAEAALQSVAQRVEAWNKEHARELAIRFEPGGALLAPCGYLVVEVRSVEEHPHFQTRVVTVDASAWNLAPWHKPHVVVVPEREGPALPGLVAGNTLYEGDFFGRDVLVNQHPLSFARCEVGDRLLITTFGAYTVTNARRFHRIPLPVEYALEAGEIRALAPAATVCP
jgi:diaminopimelate decarboxylase